MSQNLKEKVLVRISERIQILNSEFPQKSTLISPYIISFLFICKGGIFGVGKFRVEEKYWGMLGKRLEIFFSWNFF
uniref:Putative ovule protein n=1 Tax=Solanum chacoense TaxID=4108 RepID=A0A0V0H5D8_SOLCH